MNVCGRISDERMAGAFGGKAYSSGVRVKPTEVEIPFYERFRERMLARIKRCTSRTRRYGKPGDRFRQWGAVFEITLVEKMSAGEIARRYWREEGCDSEADFRAVWRKIHPRLGWSRVVHLHWFERVGGRKK